MTHQMLQEWHPYSWFGLVPFSVFITNLRNSNIWGEKKYGIKYSIKIIKKNLNLNPCFFPSNSIKLIILYKLGSMNKDLGRSSLTFPSSWLMKKKKKKKKKLICTLTTEESLVASEGFSHLLSTLFCKNYFLIELVPRYHFCSCFWSCRRSETFLGNACISSMEPHLSISQRGKFPKEEGRW